MIPRVRPPMSDNFFLGLQNFDPIISREQLKKEVGLKLKRYYPKAFNFEFLNYGRNSLAAGLDLLNITCRDNVLVPCFTCSTILDPFLKRGIKTKLYDINLDFSASLEDIEKKIDDHTKAILVTHFFGIPSNILAIKQIADEKDIRIIEDCAHIFCSDSSKLKLGSIGDIAFTSFGNDKPVSIGTGSVLIINNPQCSNEYGSKVQKYNLNDMMKEKISFLSTIYFYINSDRSKYFRYIGVYDYYHYFIKHQKEAVDDLHWLTKNYCGDFLKTIKDFSKNQSSLNELPSFYPNVTNYSLIEIFKRSSCIAKMIGIRSGMLSRIDPLLMNCFSLNMLNHIFEDVEEINKIRTENGAKFVARLMGNENIFIPRQFDAVPFLRFPLICKDFRRTTVLVDMLKGQGYEVGNFNWSPTLNRIVNWNERCPCAEKISKNIVNIPCHADVTESDIEQICQTITKGAAKVQ